MEPDVEEYDCKYAESKKEQSDDTWILASFAYNSSLFFKVLTVITLLILCLARKPSS